MPLQKLCCKCHDLKTAEHFYANTRVKDGLNSFCITCHKADNIARKKKNRSDSAFKNAEAENKKAYRAKTAAAHTAYMQAWHAKNAKQQMEYRAAYRQNNQDYFTKYAATHRAQHAAKSRHRQAALLNRTPSWLDEDDFWLMEQAYDIAAVRTKMFGFSWHVDHEIPLLGKFVSGLHVPTNLRVIPAKVNLCKSNKYTV
jgi:hypothetical protein